jgi:hypothetical protein
VADPVFFIRRQFRHRHPPAFRLEDRIVPESVRAALGKRDLPAALALGAGYFAAGSGDRDDAHEARAARRGDAAQLFQKVRPAAGIVGARARVARGAHAWFAAERLNLQAGIVRQGGEARRFGQRDRFLGRVLAEGGAVLLHFERDPEVVWKHNLCRQFSKQSAILALFAGVGRGDEQFGFGHPSGSFPEWYNPNNILPRRL